MWSIANTFEMQTRSEKYAEIRALIRRLLADLLTVPMKISSPVARTIQRIEQLLKRHDRKRPAAARAEKPRVA
jgi:hypothetical protein